MYRHRHHHVRLFESSAETVAMPVDSPGETETRRLPRRRRRRRRRIRVQHTVVRVQLGRAVRVSGVRPGRGVGRSASGQNGPVAAHAEHLLGRGHGAADLAGVHRVRDGRDLRCGPAPHAAGHRAAAETRGRRAGHVPRPAGGAVLDRAGRRARGPVRGGRAHVVRAQLDQLDVRGQLRVPVHRPGRDAHVRADRVEHRAPVRGHQRGDRGENVAHRARPSGRVPPPPPARVAAARAEIRQEHRFRVHRVDRAGRRPRLRYE